MSFEVALRIEQLKTDNAALRAMLSRIQYVDTSGGEYPGECPVCGVTGTPAYAYPDTEEHRKYLANFKPEPHEPDCELAKLLEAKP
jgi:hypothetical protein